MLLKSVKSKVERAGFVVKELEGGKFNARKDGLSYEIGWHRNGGQDCLDATCLGIKRIGHESDPQSDYCAWWFIDSVSRAISEAERMGK